MVLVTWPLHDVTWTVAALRDRLLNDECHRRCHVRESRSFIAADRVVVARDLAACVNSDSAKATDASAVSATVCVRRRRSHGRRRDVPVSDLLAWFAEYAAKTGVKINYQAIGSGGGIKQLSEQTVDFGASDAPMIEEEMAAAKGGPVMHIPTRRRRRRDRVQPSRAHAAAQAHRPVVADIYLGKITKWNDPRITALNPGVKLPDERHSRRASHRRQRHDVHLHRLSQRREPGVEGGPGAGQRACSGRPDSATRATKASPARSSRRPARIGYVELAYVKQNNLTAALFENARESSSHRSAASATAAAEAAVAKLPANTDLRVSIVNSPGAETYPITSFTWFLVYAKMPDATKAKKLDRFLGGR